jgi:hypothetical protein
MNRSLHFILLGLVWSCFSMAAWGQTTWFRTFSWESYCSGKTVLATRDSNLVFAGIAQSNQGDAFLAAADSLGNPLWYKTLGGPGQDALNYSVWNADSTVWALLGQTNSFGNGGYDAWLVLARPNGDTLKTMTLGGSGWDFGRGIFRDSDGNFLLLLHTYSSGDGGGDVRLLLMNDAGDILNDTTWVVDGIDAQPNAAHLGPSGNWLIGGTYFPGNIGESDVFVSVVQPFTLEADTTLFSGGSDEDEVYSICPFISPTGAFSWLLSGNMKDAQGRWKNFLWRISEEGDDIGRINLGLSGTTERRHSHTGYAADGGIQYTFSSRFADDSWDVSYDKTQYMNFVMGTLSARYGYQKMAGYTQIWDQGFIVVGESNEHSLGQNSAFLTRFGFDGSCALSTVLSEPDAQLPSFSVYPNPAENQLQVSGVPTGTPYCWKTLSGKDLGHGVYSNQPLHRPTQNEEIIQLIFDLNGTALIFKVKFR